MFIKPNHAVVMYPDVKRPLPPEGAEVEPNVYWYARLRDGDVSIVEPAKVKPEPVKAQTKGAE